MASLQTAPANELHGMNEIPPKHETPPQPVALTPEKETIRVSQEEFVDDMAGPSMDKSEYEANKGKPHALRPASDGDEAPRNDQT